jgi:predicted thioesterase|uniref:Putative thioesterase n=1 Tax=Eubacterium cellulosolvens (strain ATCC 43171 / JCM 9499 / 6) TaxID=633697 RepID=I5AU99_EUBC6
MLEPGIKGCVERVVTEEMSALRMGSGELMVLATPCMIAMIEEAAWKSISAELEEGQGSVGTLMDVKHTAPTPMGMKVTCETVLKEVDRRRLVFEVKAYDETGIIGEGIHERFLIDNEKFQAKAEGKKAGE